MAQALDRIFESDALPREIKRHAQMLHAFVGSHPSGGKSQGERGSLGQLHAPTMCKLIEHWIAERCQHSPTLLVPPAPSRFPTLPPVHDSDPLQSFL